MNADQIQNREFSLDYFLLSKQRWAILTFPLATKGLETFSDNVQHGWDLSLISDSAAKEGYYKIIDLMT